MRGPNYSGMAGASQEALYASIDLELSWSESELPQAARTKHVHGLHPYLGKFVPQLVEVFLRPLLPAGRPCLRPVRGLRDDAGRGERVRRGHRRLRHLRLQLPARAGQDCALLAGRARARAARSARRSSAVAPLDAGRERVAPALVRTAGSRRAAGLPPCRVPPRFALRRRRAHRPLPRRALGSADDAFRPRLPATTGLRAIPLPQAQARVPSRRGGVEVPRPLLGGHGRSPAVIRVGAERARGRGRPRRCTVGAARPRDRRDHFAPVPRLDRLPRAASLRL